MMKLKNFTIRNHVNTFNVTALTAFSNVMLYSHDVIAEPEHHAEHGVDHVLAGDEQIDALHAEINGLPQLDFTTYTPQLFWMVMIFALLYIVFAKKTLPDISGVIENRKNHIQSNLENAEKLTAEADSVHDAYNDNLATSQAAASTALHKAEQKIKDKAARAMEDFKTKSDSELQKAEKRIEKSKIAAMGDMNNIVAETATVAVEKIIGTSDTTKVKAIVKSMTDKDPRKVKAA